MHRSRGFYLVGGGSVSPTSGVANPTLTIVAPALRLSAFLAGDRDRTAPAAGV